MVSLISAATMSSRDIAELVEAKHSNVCVSIERLMAKGAIGGYAAAQYTHPQNGQTYSEYHINKRDSYVIVAQLSPEFTARLVDRWQELESQALTLPNFNDPIAAARAWADAKEGEIKALGLIQTQREQLSLAAPKVDFVDKYVDSTGLKTFRQVAKLINASERDFRDFLKAEKIMYKLAGEWTAYSAHIDAGRFSVRAGIAENGHDYSATRFTAKGVAWIAGLWASKQAEKTLRAEV